MDRVLTAFEQQLRTLVVGPYNAPSRSMAPTVVGCAVALASKTAHGYSRFPMAVH